MRKFGPGDTKASPGRTDAKVQICLQTQTSCRLKTGMDNCVAAMTAAVAAYRRRKPRIKNNNQLAPVLGLIDKEDVMCPESISVALATCVVQQVRPRYRLNAVGGHLHSTICMARCGLPAAFVWLCRSKTVEDYVLYHATVGCK